MPFMEQPNFDIGLGMGPDFNPPDWLNQVDFGDNIDQGGGWNPGSGGGLGGLLGAGKGLGGLLGGGKGLGGLLGGAGGLDLTSLLAMLGMGYGGYKGNQASKEPAVHRHGQERSERPVRADATTGTRRQVRATEGQGHAEDEGFHFAC
jgi:hypothetical protein